MIHVPRVHFFAPHCKARCIHLFIFDHFISFLSKIHERKKWKEKKRYKKKKWILWICVWAKIAANNEQIIIFARNSWDSEVLFTELESQIESSLAEFILEIWTFSHDWMNGRIHFVHRIVRELNSTRAFLSDWTNYIRQRKK